VRDVWYRGPVIMATSRKGNRALIAALVAAVVGLSVALFMVTRPRPDRDGDARAATPATAPDPAASDRGSSFAQARRPGLVPDGPPARAFNDLGQPLDENGRPIGPPHKLQGLRNRPIAEGELPITPPRFDDAAQRARFKKWWVDEFARRVAVFEKLEPGEGYPGAGETTAMLDELYDTSEPRGPDETVEQAIERRRRGREIARRFLDIYNVPPYTIVTRGGDPQHGAPTPPPFQPPGADVEPGPPAEPATEAPPGRDPTAPRRTEPLDEDGAGRAPETRDAPNRR
jgi:hypothetical protein